MEPQAQVDIIRSPGRSKGRPSLYTPEIAELIIASIADGDPIAVAAGAAGVSYDSFNDWYNLGEAGDPRYADFYQRCYRAKYSGQKKLALPWRAAADKDWKAAQKYLATVYPETWAETTNVNIRSEAQVQVQHTLTIGDAASLLGLISTLQPAQLVEGTVIEQATDTE